MSSSKAIPPATTTWNVPGGSEYRFELDQTEAIAIQVRPRLAPPEPLLPHDLGLTRPSRCLSAI